MAAVQSSQIESLEIRESGRALKVQTDHPHLVSIGSGRLSTNVTLHPLPEGKVTLGTSPDADIVLQGTGVQPRHCIIENTASVVTLHPLADMTTVDGLHVSAPTRLCQGNMLCIGRSNYLRFNHPAEANLMKKYLPNTRISMASPLNYFGNGDGLYEKKPPMAPTKRSRDSWGEISNGSAEDASSKPSKYEMFPQTHSKSISPKVFPPGSATVNSPAAVVLGHSRIPNGLLAAPEGKFKGPENGNLDYIEPAVPQTISSYPQKATVSAFPQHQQNGFADAEFEATGRVSSPRILTMPSPAFNRNPSPYVPDKFRSITPNIFAGRPLSPASHRSPEEESTRLMTRSFDSRLSPSFGQETQEPRNSKDSFQVQDERPEQRSHMSEKQKLDEILNMCAEYERQIQNERQSKAPTTPTLQQNRIKTNGSLPRDKRSNGLPSPLAPKSDDELNQIFTFDTTKSSSAASASPTKTRNCIYDNVRVVNSTLQFENSETLPKSPYENLAKGEHEGRDQYDVSSVFSKHVYVENTLTISPQMTEKLAPPQSPRTRIRTTVRDHFPRDQTELAKQPSGFEDYDTADPVKYRDQPGNVQMRKFLTPSQQLNKFSNLTNLMSSGEQRLGDQNKFILPLENSNELTDLMMTLEKEFSATLSELRDSDKSNSSGSEVRKGDSWMNDELNNELPESERDLHRAKSEGGPGKEEPKKTEIQLRQKKTNVDWGKLKVEKSALLGVVTRLKTEINSLEQQEDEILREMKMEMALLNAEYISQKEKHRSDEGKLSGLKEKQKQLDVEIEQCKSKDSEMQKSQTERIEELKREMEKLEESLGDQRETSDEYRNLQEKLETEKKAFEDAEFKQLEEEANWLATKDELQREVQEIAGRIEARQSRLAELEEQIRDIEKTSQTETSSLGMQKVELLRQLEAARTKMKELDVRLSAESMSETSSAGQEGPGSLRDRSKEDLVRISKVTSDAPIDVGKTGSLGRKTIESLKEIERNRHLHLAKQGSQVIEEERKRVEQLKRRVQDEVRAQWEQSRQRECNSLNSVGSEESNITCSDQPTESASSDDVEKTLPAAILPEDVRNSSDSYDKVRKDLDAGDFRNSRPISDYSGSEFEQQVTVKKRENKPMRLMQQRPLTRYLPIKSESLNLRHHIESAGHQVDLCPHVSIDATSCRGVLHKLGGKFHHWNKRWFVFDRTKRALLYYSDKSEKKQRGGTYFQAIEEVYVDHLNSVKSPNPHVTFVIKTHERTYYLMAPSPEAMRIWVDVIFTGAEGYQEFEHGS